MRTTLAPILGSILAAVAPVVACGDEAATTMPEAALCPDPTAANRYASFTLGPNVDGVVFYDRHRSGNADAAGDAGAVEDFAPGNGSLGTVCGGAADRAACLAKVRSATATDGWSYAQIDDRAANELDYGVVTKGDEVRVITTVDELRALVAPIESRDEAAAMAVFSNRRVACGRKNARTEADGYVLQWVGGGCGGPEIEHLFKVHRDGTITDVAKNELSSGDPNCIEGRRPAGYVGATRPWLASLAVHLAEIAHMEAAAVLAFADLRDELAGRGAPAALVARLERARVDEVAHAAIMRDRAAAYGATPPPVERHAPRSRSLLALAIENVTEGCVREAYGALVAAHQAAHAKVPPLRSAFARIAKDEAEHAALSLDLRDWLASQLAPEQRAVVAAAEEAAWDELERECAALTPSPEVASAAGMPTARVACMLVRSLRASLAAAA